MIKHYMRAFYPGTVVAETQDTLVENRDPPKMPPKGAFCLCFYDREEEEKNGEILRSNPKNYSPHYYWGEVFTLERLKKEYAHEPILIGNVECNGYKRAIKTIRGNWQTLGDNDVVVE